MRPLCIKNSKTSLQKVITFQLLIAKNAKNSIDYENITTVYRELNLPMPMDNKLLRHKKEQVVYMIVNLLRVKPKIFM